MQDIKRELMSFARRGERYAATLGRHLPEEWVRFTDGMGPYWRRGDAQVRATLEEPEANGVALAVVSVSTMRGAMPSRPSPALVREVARVFLGRAAENLPQVDALPGGAAVMVECGIRLLQPVGEA